MLDGHVDPAPRSIRGRVCQNVTLASAHIKDARCINALLGTRCTWINTLLGTTCLLYKCIPLESEVRAHKTRWERPWIDPGSGGEREAALLRCLRLPLDLRAPCVPVFFCVISTYCTVRGTDRGVGERSIT